AGRLGLDIPQRHIDRAEYTHRRSSAAPVNRTDKQPLPQRIYPFGIAVDQKRLIKIDDRLDSVWNKITENCFANPGDARIRQNLDKCRAVKLRGQGEIISPTRCQEMSSNV